MHEAREPNAVFDFFDAEALPGKHGGDVDLFSVHADSSAGGDEDVLVMEGVAESWKG